MLPINNHTVSEQPHLSLFFNNKMLSDIEVADSLHSKSYIAHKIVLASKSAYFFQKFKEDAACQKLTLPLPIQSTFQPNNSNCDVLSRILQYYFYSDHLDSEDGGNCRTTLLASGLDQRNCMIYYSYLSMFQSTVAAETVQQYILQNMQDSSTCIGLLLDGIKFGNTAFKDFARLLIAQQYLPLILNNVSLAKLFKQIPFQDFLELISLDEITGITENQLLQLVHDYIEVRESLPERQAQQDKIDGKDPSNNKQAAQGGTAIQPQSADKSDATAAQGGAQLSEFQKFKQFATAELQEQPQQPANGNVPPPNNNNGTQPQPAADQQQQSPSKVEESKEQQQGSATENYLQGGSMKGVLPQALQGAQQLQLSILLQQPQPEQQQQPQQQSVPPVQQELPPLQQAPSQQNEPEKQQQMSPAKQEGGGIALDPNNLDQPATLLLQNFKLTHDEKAKLLQNVRLAYIDHNFLVQVSQYPVFQEFKDIFFQAISAKLNFYEQGEYVPQYGFNVDPRQSGGQFNSAAAKQLAKSNVQNLYSNKVGGGGGQQMYSSTPPQIQQGFHSHTSSGGISALSWGSGMHNMVIGNQNKSPFTPLNELGQVVDPVNPHRVQTTEVNKIIQPRKPVNQQQQISPKFTQMYNSTGNPLDEVIQYQSTGQPPEEFVYQQDFDENGALYFIGTCGLQKPYRNPHNLGLVKVFISSLRTGKLEDFVGRESVNLSTQGEKNSYAGCDLGAERYIFPTCYTMRNRNATTHALINWVLEGSVNGIDWYVLDKRIHFSKTNAQFNKMMENERQLLMARGGTSTWGIDTTALMKFMQKNYVKEKGFRMFKITQLFENSNGTDNLCISGFEIYGRPYGRKWLFA